MKFIMCLFLFSLNSFATELLSSQEQECSKFEVLQHSFLEISNILFKGRWSPCLENPQEWKRILEAKKLNESDLKFVKEGICQAGEFAPSQNKWCDRQWNECPVCDLGSFEMMYGKEKAQEKYLEYLKEQQSWRERRVGFIKKHILKQNSDFKW